MAVRIDSIVTLDLAALELGGAVRSPNDGAASFVLVLNPPGSELRMGPGSLAGRRSPPATFCGREPAYGGGSSPLTRSAETWSMCWKSYPVTLRRPDTWALVTRQSASASRDRGPTRRPDDQRKATCCAACRWRKSPRRSFAPRRPSAASCIVQAMDHVEDQ